jgi:hypothetical protein
MITRICNEIGETLLIPQRNERSKVGSITGKGNEPKMRGSRIGE